MSSLLSVRGLSHAFGRKQVADNINLEFEQGEMVSVIGPSGCGKTTLTRFITGNLRPQSGSVFYEGEDIFASSQKLAKFHQDLSYLFQNGSLFPDLNVYCNVAFPLREKKLPETQVHQRVLKTLDEVGLRGAKALFPLELSGGMNRRVAFARAIVTTPKIVFLDEPFTGQDPIAKGVMMRLIEQLKAAKVTVIMVSHDLPETFEISDKVVMLAAGRVVANGLSSEVQKSEVPEVKQFVHGEFDGPVSFYYPSSSSMQDDLRDVS